MINIGSKKTNLMVNDIAYEKDFFQAKLSLKNHNAKAKILFAQSN